jgi:hypothetical protein
MIQRLVRLYNDWSRCVVSTKRCHQRLSLKFACANFEFDQQQRTDNGNLRKYILTFIQLKKKLELITAALPFFMGDLEDFDWKSRVDDLSGELIIHYRGPKRGGFSNVYMGTRTRDGTTVSHSTVILLAP